MSKDYKKMLRWVIETFCYYENNDFDEGDLSAGSFIQYLENKNLIKFIGIGDEKIYTNDEYFEEK